MVRRVSQKSAVVVGSLPLAHGTRSTAQALHVSKACRALQLPGYAIQTDGEHDEGELFEIDSHPQQNRHAPSRRPRIDLGSAAHDHRSMTARYAKQTLARSPTRKHPKVHKSVDLTQPEGAAGSVLLVSSLTLSNLARWRANLARWRAFGRRPTVTILLATQIRGVSLVSARLPACR